MMPNLAKSITQNPILKIDLFFKAILLLIILVAVLMPLLHIFYVYPSFTKELLKSTEEEAIRTGTHMMKMLFESGKQTEVVITNKKEKDLLAISKNFSVLKIKVFSPAGKVLYSTAREEIGTINSESYFHKLVTKGNTHTKVVTKDTRTLEGQLITRDVVETYVPILLHDRFVGAFEIYYDITERKRAFDQHISTITYQLFFLSLLLIITISIIFLRAEKMLKERRDLEEKLEYLANTDALTNLRNRRHFLEYLNNEISRFTRYNHPAALLIFDIDRFKKVNDTYGHLAGDNVLIKVATTCRNMLRENDLIGRYGGEEFIVFLPEVNTKQAVRVAEKLRGAVESLPLEHLGKKFSVNISIGVAPFPVGEPINADIVIQNADQALYEAKNNGRNQVVCYQPKD